MMKGNKIQIAYKHSKSLVYRRQAKLPEQKPQIVFFWPQFLCYSASSVHNQSVKQKMLLKYTE